MNQLRKCRLNEFTTKYMITADQRNIRSSISTRLKSLRKYDAREEKENLRNHST